MAEEKLTGQNLRIRQNHEKALAELEVKRQLTLANLPKGYFDRPKKAGKK